MSRLNLFISTQMKLYFIIALVLLRGLACYGQELTILDKESKRPLELVSVYSSDMSVFMTSNAKGKVKIESSSYSKVFNFSLLGYEPQRFSYDSLRALNFTVKLNRSSINLNQVVISAVRWQQKKSDLPARLSSMGEKEFYFQNPQTAADLLQVNDQVFIQKSQLGGGSPMIRGFSTNRLLYSVDGVRMNTAIFRSGNLQNVISLDPFSIEQTEVLFGPGSVIYGSDAIGGVMNFQSLSAQLSTNDSMINYGSTSLRYSSANQEQTIHSHFGLGWKKWAALSSFSFSKFDDLRMGSNGPKDYEREVFVERVNEADIIINNPNPNIQVPSGYQQKNFLQKIRYKPNKQLDIIYGFHYSESSDYARYDRHLRERNNRPRYGAWYYGPQKWMMNLIQLNWKRNLALFDQMNLRLAQQSFEESRNSRDFGSLIKEKRIENVEAYSLNLDFQKKWNKHSFYYGLEAILNDVKSKGFDKNIGTGLSEKGPSRYPNSNWYSTGIYLNDHLQLSNRFILELGARYNFTYLESAFDTSFYPFPFTKAILQNKSITGNVGIVFKASEKVKLYGSAAKAFRSPNVDDIGKVFDSEPGSVVVPNPQLEAEEAYNIEYGFDLMIAKKIRLDGAVYYTWLDQAMVRRDFSLNGKDSIVYNGELSQVQAIQNAAKAEVFGFQFGLQISFNKNLSLKSNFNYQEGVEEMDNGENSPSRHAAPWFGSLRLNYSKKQFQAEFYLLANGERAYKDLNIGERGKAEIYAADKLGRPYSPAWYTLNTKINYSFNSHFNLSLGLENILDKRYKTYSSGIAAPGRNFISSIRYQF